MSFIPDSHHVKSRCKTYRQPQCHMAGYLIYTEQKIILIAICPISIWIATQKMHRLHGTFIVQYNKERHACVHCFGHCWVVHSLSVTKNIFHILTSCLGSFTVINIFRSVQTVQ